MAYRRAVLLAVDGFDERFPRAYREDADLALRVRQAGWRLSVGRREVHHPVRPAGPATSVRVQRGNADDALMRRLHGPRWRELAGTGRGLFRRHASATGAAAAAVLALASSSATEVAAPERGSGRSRAARAVAGVGGTAYLVHVADLVRRRVAPGPRTPREVATMALDERGHPAGRDVAPDERVVAPPGRRRVAPRPASSAPRPGRDARPRRPLQRGPGGRRSCGRRS